MMNIVSQEGVIHGMRRLKEKFKDTPQYYKYDMDIFKHQMVLTDLSGNLNPEDLMKEMMRFS
jgi:hypothetical protein